MLIASNAVTATACPCSRVACGSWWQSGPSDAGNAGAAISSIAAHNNRSLRLFWVHWDLSLTSRSQRKTWQSPPASSEPAFGPDRFELVLAPDLVRTPDGHGSPNCCRSPDGGSTGCRTPD